jgi:hypothetical protein
MRRERSALVSLAVSALLPLAPIAAQESPFLPQLSPGVRVRIDAPGVLGGRLATTVVSRTRDSVKVRARERNEPAKDEERLDYLTVALDRITSVEVSGGRSQLKGAAVGLLAGAAVGVALANMGALVGADDNAREVCNRGFPCDGPPTLQSAMVGATIGGFLGLFFGRERWTRVDFAPRASLERGVTGGTLALHLHF